MLQGRASGTQFPDPHTAALHVKPISPHPTGCQPHNRPQVGPTPRRYRPQWVLQRKAACLLHPGRLCISWEPSSRAFDPSLQPACAFLLVRMVLG